MLVFMVRESFSKLEFPYVQFPCASTSGDVIAERLSARHPNSAARSRLAMFVCMYVRQSRFRNSIIVTLRNSGRSVEARAR